jgi:hypothetical protein
MARRTRSAVSGVTLSEPLIVRETVAVDTLASLATSLMFMSHPKYNKPTEIGVFHEFAGSAAYCKSMHGSLLRFLIVEYSGEFSSKSAIFTACPIGARNLVCPECGVALPAL